MRKSRAILRKHTQLPAILIFIYKVQYTETKYFHNLLNNVYKYKFCCHLIEYPCVSNNGVTVNPV